MRAAALAIFLLAPLPAGAQGLGDAASREREKRQAQKAPPAKVFTEEDLKPAVIPRDSDSPGPEGSADASPDPSSRGASSGSGDEGSADFADPLEKERRERRLLEAEWRVRFANAREQLAIAEENSWVEVVRTEFVAGVPVQMKVKEQVETEELKRARQALADLEEEFRRTGLPPGWARDGY